MLRLWSANTEASAVRPWKRTSTVGRLTPTLGTHTRGLSLVSSSDQLRPRGVACTSWAGAPWALWAQARLHSAPVQALPHALEEALAVLVWRLRSACGSAADAQPASACMPPAYLGRC